MWDFAAFCDEFYVNSRLYLKLELSPDRDTLLHFFEQIRKRYPRMTQFYRRDDEQGSLVLEEIDDEGVRRRFLRLDPTAIKFGCSLPQDADAVATYGLAVLSQAPPQLSLSELDYDHMDVIFGFDLEYRGNHDQLVSETLFPEVKLLSALTADESLVIDCQPFFGFRLSADCQKQMYVEIKNRTSSYELISGEFESQVISVTLTIRRYWDAGAEQSLPDVHRDLLVTGERFAGELVVPYVVQPLQTAISNQRG